MYPPDPNKYNGFISDLVFLCVLFTILTTNLGSMAVSGGAQPCVKGAGDGGGLRFCDSVCPFLSSVFQGQPLSANFFCLLLFLQYVNYQNLLRLSPRPAPVHSLITQNVFVSYLLVVI